MDLRSVLRVCFAILSILGYCVAFIGYKNLEKTVKEASTQREIFKRKHKQLLIKNVDFVYFATIVASIFAIIAIFLNR